MASGAPFLPARETCGCELGRELRRIGPALARRDRSHVEVEPPDPETRLVALARAGAPLRRALARLAGRMEALRGWERIGCARRRDYAVERLGISGRQLQELARMDHAFDGLASLERAFVSGCLSWTKARLLARVATAEDADAWIAHAACVTARELSREVRAVDARARDPLAPETDEDGASEDEDKETVFVRCTPAIKAKWYRARFWASRIEGRPVFAWELAENLAAEALSAVPPDAAALDQTSAVGEACTGPEPLPSAPPASVDAGARLRPEIPTRCTGHGVASQSDSSIPQPWSAAAAPAAPNACAGQGPLLASLLDRLDEADAFELDTRLRRAIAAEQRLTAQMGPLLLGLARGRLYRRYGCPSLGAFAREWLGMSPSKADSLVRLERAGEIAPPLREAYRAGRLSWSQALLLVPLLRRENAVPWQAAWVAHAERVSVRRLGDEVAQALARDRPEPPPLDPPNGRWPDASDDDRNPELEDPLPDSQTRAHASDFPKTMAFFFTAPRDAARLFRGALATVQRRIERRTGRTASESEALDAILEHAFETWGVGNARLKREHRVFERDGWRCTFPGCTSYANLHDHHIEYRSHGGADALSNRTTLCVWHHQRGEHAKVVRCRGQAPGKLRFALGLRAGHPPLARYRSGDMWVA